ncbi:hypothetical protein [Neochlamydia sp. EPS4]|uniref:hypothetical protein n=1 Tax=Neochlamydia sp. EPS4 TaxID=1478175 RepID=UPI00069389BF|nr:hypothetical protein [Neochlamydia sp. EPS4]
MKKYLKFFILFSLFIICAYSAGRLYYALTGGFTIGNISSNLSYNEKWVTPPLSSSEKEDLHQILSQKFRYLGKGCQSYVFASEDGLYVLKFIKYQRFRPQAWLDYFASIPFVNRYRLAKIEKKHNKLNMLFTSWKIAYEHLKPETGLVYVHLNKSHDLKKSLTIYDKLGFAHQLNMDEMEFLLQKRATMLCSTINNFVTNNQVDEAKKLIDNLLKMILSEYQRGYADNDHALMQNTGAIGTAPFHIDVGQFVVNLNISDPTVYKQELFSKTFKFRLWLAKHHPELKTYLDKHLLEIIGPEMHQLIPRLKNPHAWSVEA